MLQILLVPSNKIVATLLASQRDAQAEAIRQVKEWMNTTPHGKRLLTWCKGIVTWKIASQYVVITEMVGVWIDTQGGRILPEDIEDDEMLLYKNMRGAIMLGTYSVTENTFTDSASEHTLDGDRVTAFLVIPTN